MVITWAQQAFSSAGEMFQSPLQMEYFLGTTPLVRQLNPRTVISQSSCLKNIIGNWKVSKLLLITVAGWERTTITEMAPGVRNWLFQPMMLVCCPQEVVVIYWWVVSLQLYKKNFEFAWASLLFVIGPDKSCHKCNKSDSKVVLVATWSLGHVPA